MKRMVKELLLASLFCGLTLFGAAQTAQKFGHINSTELMQLIPGRDTAEKQLQEFARQLEAQMGLMNSEYEAKVTEFQSLPAGTSELIRNTKIQDIGDMEQRIQSFQANAQSELQNKESELLSPLLDKAREAIQEVAKENGYTYVFDSGVGVLLYQPESDDILPLVKKKLGITQ